MRSYVHTVGRLRLRLGHPLPFGASCHPDGGINFSIFSVHATHCTLVLFHPREDQPYIEIPFPQEFRIGHLFAMTVWDLRPEELEYGFRMEGPVAPKEGHLFDGRHILLDPQARVISSRNMWGQDRHKRWLPPRGRMPLKSFDWVDDLPLRFPSDELVIYEMHVRGFTRHQSSGVVHGGTFEGVKEKIPYLKQLGVNCVEFMPIFEFDELENPRTNPLSGAPLHNYWGYNTIGYHAPKAGFASNGNENLQTEELKSLIRELHQAGIRVLLDVVFNHTAEGNLDGPTISFRGIDNKTYYMINDEGRYLDYTGCGNTLNCGHPVVRQFILDCLRYWVTDFHVDGFRFDLASVLGRDSDGRPLENPPLLEEIAHDPVLADCELIAEAWDVGGLYQVGSFPAYQRWKEWNGKYRDCARRFLKGELGTVGEMVQRIMGSPDLYATSGRGPTASINFIACHDGFTLRDLFSYNEKHNWENGEENRDGSEDNYSWNCGIEGETSEPSILDLRQRLQKNAIALLFVSQGIPMIYMGDECGRTQRGNNNPYCHDEPWNWLDWTLPNKNTEFFRFVRNMIAFRKANPLLRQKNFLNVTDLNECDYPDISWHGVEPWSPDWSESSQSLAFLLCGPGAGTIDGKPKNFIYCAFNSFYQPLTFGLPELPEELCWHQFANTGSPYPEDIYEVGAEQLLEKQTEIALMERSCVILLGKYRSE
ncbi:MAG: glycogen debranching enzyme GlgX [Verrucomicrobia bacterium]|nr:MAG: glycogen debranching enzyme GlgX [Verrucomicrobiota bacterium]